MYFGGFSFPLCRLLSHLQLQCNTGIQIILCKYGNISTPTNILQACNQGDFTSEVCNTSVQLEIFQGKVFWNKGTSISFSSITHERKAPYGKMLEFFLDTLKHDFK